MRSASVLWVRCVVFSRPPEIKVGLVFGVKFNRNLLPKEAVEIVDKIAGLLR